ncbi:MAG: DUF2092 domain-containing protein [Planctomycetota bacterium]|nr:DUF2092 domain-containing protein [Planctomycetota bacterium]
MIARIPYFLMTGAGLIVMMTFNSMASAQETADDSRDDVERSDAETQLDDYDDPIWPIKHGIDPTADRILRNMSDYLASVEAFTFTIEVAEDVMLSHGQMIQYGGVSEVAVQRPGSLHARFRGEERTSNIVINDGRCTLHNLETNMYAVAEVPSSLDAAIDLVVEQFSLNVPVADLVSTDVYASVIGSVEYGYVVGRSSIDGVDCHHLAFAQAGIDWQIWIQAGPEPLVRKLVITYKDEPGWPQYTTRILHWNLSPRLSKHYFEYEPPADAVMIDFLPNQSEEIDQ